MRGNSGALQTVKYFKREHDKMRSLLKLFRLNFMDFHLYFDERSSVDITALPLV